MFLDISAWLNMAKLTEVTRCVDISSLFVKPCFTLQRLLYYFFYIHVQSLGYKQYLKQWSSVMIHVHCIYMYQGDVCWEIWLHRPHHILRPPGLCSARHRCWECVPQHVVAAWDRGPERVHGFQWWWPGRCADARISCHRYACAGTGQRRWNSLAQAFLKQNVVPVRTLKLSVLWQTTLKSGCKSRKVQVSFTNLNVLTDPVAFCIYIHC